MPQPGKTSIYLKPALAERVSASGIPLATLVERGLDAGEPEPPGRPATPGEVQRIVEQSVRREVGDMLTSHGVEQQRIAEGWVRRIVREELARVAGSSAVYD